MNTAIATCAAMAVAEGGAGAAPEWLHLLPAGEARTVDGRGPYRLADPKMMIAASMARGKLVLDENHATDLAAPKGLPAPARGWIVELQQRADGIWGRVDWTDDAKRSQAWRQYRGVSPVIAHNKDGEVLAIARASLTNTPNLTGLTTLHHSGTSMDIRTQLANIASLPVDRSLDEIIGKLRFLLKGEDDQRNKPEKSTHAQASDLALQAASYRAEKAREGITIDLATAVRAVANGQ